MIFLFCFLNNETCLPEVWEVISKNFLNVVRAPNEGTHSTVTKFRKNIDFFKVKEPLRFPQSDRDFNVCARIKTALLLSDKLEIHNVIRRGKNEEKLKAFNA